MNEEAFLKGMYKLGLQWREHDMPADAVALYRERLGRLTDEEFEIAVNRCLDTCVFYPKISELLGVIKALRPGAQEAWNRLLKAAESGELPEMDAPTAAGLAATGGWDQLQYTAYKELTFSFKVFEEAYQKAEDRQEIEPKTALPGGQAPRQLEQPTGHRVC